MKIQNIYHLLQAALLLLLVSCTQEEFPAVQDKAQQLTISVTDGGYTSAVENMKTRVETRAVENGYTTEFTEGDACGFYMVRGGKPVYSNVKLTAEKDAATGGIMWKTDGTTLAAGMDGESYYLYYPYQADMAGKTATPAEGAVMTDAEFFKPLIDGWQPGDDQSTHAAYTASDPDDSRRLNDRDGQHHPPLFRHETPHGVGRHRDAEDRLQVYRRECSRLHRGGRSYVHRHRQAAAHG